MRRLFDDLSRPLGMAALLLTGLAVAAPADGDVFLVDKDGPLYTLDLSTQEFQFVGDPGIDLGPIALDPEGRLFAVSASGLHRLDTLDGSQTLVGPWGQSLQVDALAFDPSGRLWMSADGGFYEVDPVTAQFTLLSTPAARIQGLAFVDGRFLALASIGNDWALYSVDRSTGGVTEFYSVPLAAPQTQEFVTFVSMDGDALDQGLLIFVASFTVIGLPPLSTLTLDRLDLLTGELEQVGSFVVSSSGPFAAGSAASTPGLSFSTEVPGLGDFGVAALCVLLMVTGTAALRRR